jgi:Domain of unknown function (DUF4806)
LENGALAKSYYKFGLAKILTDDLWIDFNWAGRKDKKALNKYDLFTKVAFGERK